MPMSCSPDPREVWVAIGPDPLLRAIEPLREAHARHATALLVRVNQESIETTLTELAAQFADHRVTILVLENEGHSSARSQFTTPLIGSHARCAIGWLQLDEDSLHSYALRAASILQRVR